MPTPPLTIFRARELESVLEREGYTLRLEEVEFGGGVRASLGTFFGALNGRVNESIEVVGSIDELDGERFRLSDLWKIWFEEGTEALVLRLDDRWLEQWANDSIETTVERPVLSKWLRGENIQKGLNLGLNL